ncbi:uncharacterized protein LOC123203059 [Mangifera indica]|uniref:uncharacterized protein LOC123203059 n=1 Tax=Mangifera indica TaxID=29780 RepID=UPI001CF9903F|nr:uncharacterized protein LOC123203059 [Mangifera indica]
MATSAVFPPATVAGAVVRCGSRTQKRMKKVLYLNGLNSYGGLKAHNEVVSLGITLCTEQCFANVVSSLKTTSKRRGGGGGALWSTCDAASEIFRIAAIMNGLVLVGVAVGFVLLRIEAWLEESE